MAKFLGKTQMQIVKFVYLVQLLPCCLSSNLARHGGNPDIPKHKNHPKAPLENKLKFPTHHSVETTKQNIACISKS